VSQLEAWEMVNVSENFLSTPHGRIGCVVCHGGDKTAFDKDSAHQNIEAVTSDNAKAYCSGCHEDIVNQYHPSLHKTQKGYLKRIENRLGYSIENDAAMMGKFKAECGKCHGTCGQCHVQRPTSVKGGFTNGHVFGEPERDNNCVACHGSRVGEEYLGQREGYFADVHRYKPGGSKCTFCHTGDEMHGDAGAADYRYLVQNAPSCEGCHEDKSDANIYHQTHWKGDAGTTLSCQVCHSQPYKNCNACHTGGAGITGSSYIAFKIAKNKFNIRAESAKYDYVTVRHIPVAPDTYASWGISDLPNFGSEPTWKYTTPHNIQRWTAQTDTTGTNGNCYLKCHDQKEYYLLSTDLFDYEVDANKDIVMDDKVPSSSF